jgi:DNA-binding transcriptional MerR regulator
MSLPTLTVGEVAKRADLGVQTLHYYERLGLLPKPRRSAANYRLYDPEIVERLRFIKKAHSLGFTLEEIREILSLRDHGRAPCRRVAELGERRLQQVEQELARLEAFRGALAAALPRWKKETSRQRRCAGEFCDLIEQLPAT